MLRYLHQIDYTVICPLFHESVTLNSHVFSMYNFFYIIINYTIKVQYRPI